MISRRTFMKAGGAAFALLAMKKKAYGWESPALRKWIQPLAGLGPNGIPVAASDGTRTWGSTVATHYTIDLRQFTQQLHPDLPGPTTLWGYGQGAVGNFRHLGGLIVTKRNAPVQITFRNYLPATNPIPVDAGPFFPDSAIAQNRVAIHLHGGLVPWISDGGPYEWFAPATNTGDIVGPSFINNQVLAPANPAGTGEYYYPNDQSARLMWYHDHAHDLTRLNAYAGLATGYIVRDDIEAMLIRQGAIPSREIPLVFQDKVFDKVTGNLWYPSIYDPLRWAVDPNNSGSLYSPSCIPEAFGDTPLVNGLAYPKLTVEARRYRFRVLNACNARFLNLQLYVEDGSAEGFTLVQNGTDPAGIPVWVPAPTVAAGPEMLQIGNECGFLFGTASHNNPPKPLGYDTDPLSPGFGNANQYSLLMAPAERADLIIDFTGFAGQKILLYNDASAPFPGGDPLNDYFIGQDLGLNPTPQTPGSGPNTRTIMEFNVVPRVGAADPYTWTQLKTILNATLSRLAVTLNQGAAGPPRELTLNEEFDAWGRLIQRVGTLDPTPTPLPLDPAGTVPVDYGRYLADPPTEIINAGATEIWRIWNLTGDTHPMHFHLINAQIISRQPFDGNVPGNITGPPRGPDANEIGWKETIRCNPLEVVTFIAKFDLPRTPFTVPASPRIGGMEYVYHCHILEHEEHDMMRPLKVI